MFTFLSLYSRSAGCNFCARFYKTTICYIFFLICSETKEGDILIRKQCNSLSTFRKSNTSFLGILVLYLFARQRFNTIAHNPPFSSSISLFAMRKQHQPTFNYYLIVFMELSQEARVTGRLSKIFITKVILVSISSQSSSIVKHMTEAYNGESFTTLFTMTPKILSLITISLKCAQIIFQTVQKSDQLHQENSIKIFCEIGNRQKACLTKLYRFDCVFLPKTTHKQAQWRGDLIHYFRNLHLFT